MRPSRTSTLVFVPCFAASVISFAACGGRTGSDPLDTSDAGGTGGGGGSSADAALDVAWLSCEEQTRLASTRISDAVTEAQKDLSCTTDGDCTNVDISAVCAASCTAYVNLAGAKTVSAAIAEINDTVCRGFTTSKGCKIAVPPCVPVASPRCLSGQCTPLR